MNHWFCKNLGDPLLADPELDRIKDLFQQTYQHANQAAHQAIFIRHVSEGQLHCKVQLYFSPDTAEIARAVTAHRCPPPSPHDLGLLAGSEDSWDLLKQVE